MSAKPIEITFEIVDPNEPEDGEWRSVQNPSPYVGLSAWKLEESLRCLQNADDIVIPQSQIKVMFSYPLASKHILVLNAPDGKDHFTREGLCRAISKKYQQIYEEEEKGTTLPVESVGERNERLNPCGNVHMLNRASTNGRWGIWGHDLSDLDLCDVSSNNGKDEYWTLGIDS